MAYHSSCLPKNCLQNVSGKRIICPKHSTTASLSSSAALSSGSSASSSSALLPLSVGEDAGTAQSDLERSTAGSSALSKTAVSRLSEQEQDEGNRSESSVVSVGGSKKLSKSAKREKKKKKKKRKKNKKRESRDRQSQGDDDDSMDEQLTDKEAVKTQSGEEHVDAGLVDRKDESRVKKEPAVSDVAVTGEPMSPVVAERSKSRLADVLGPSDDEIESPGSPIIVPAMKREKSTSVDMSVLTTATDERDITSPRKSEETPGVKRDMSTDDASSVKSPVAAADDDSSQGPSDYFSSSQSSAEVGSGSSGRKSRKSSHSSSTRTRNEDGKTKSRKKQRRDAPSIDIPVMPRDGLSAGEEGDDEGPGGSSTPSRRSIAGSSMSGEGVKEKSSNRSGKSKKKKSPSKSADSSLGTKPDNAEEKPKEQDEEDEDEEEAKWVQCDSCKKWRTVPKELDLDTMPDHWYCYMNTWDRVYASCDVDEEIVEPKSSSAAANHNKNGSRKSKSKKHAPPLAPITVPLDAGFLDTIGTPSLSSSGVLQSAGNDSANEKDKHNKAKKQGDRSKKRKIKQLKDKYREVKWVQCESAQCGKWRVVPSSIDFSLLPSVWYCRLNTWAPELANCSVPNPLEVESFLLKSQSKKGGSATPTSGPAAPSSGAARPSKKHKSSTGSDTGSAGGTGASGTTAFSDGGGLHIAPVILAKASGKQGKAKVGTPVAASNSAARSAAGGVSGATNSGAMNGNAMGSSSSASHAVSAVASAPNCAIAAHNGNGKGRRDGIKKTVLEWAQCEKCEKWRKLPSHIKSSTLPDKWYCNMNHWDPSRANCSIAEEVDQEPLHAASPLPSSQNWYPMPGQGGGNGLNVGGNNGIRSKRGKLSYSELLYASTGQLRKTYTAESSTLSFEYQGTMYHRDDQYKHSSMYISPATALAKQAARTISNDRKPDDKKDDSSANRNKSASINGTEAAPTATRTDVTEAALVAVGVDLSSQQLDEVERIGELILDAMNLRTSKSFEEVVETIHRQLSDGSSQPSVSIAVITAAVNQLIQKGLIEKLALDRVASEEDAVANKRQKTTDSPFDSSSMPYVAHYRKVPTRPLKASKRWHHLATQGPSRDPAV